MAEDRYRLQFLTTIPGYITITCGAIAGLWGLNAYNRRKIHDTPDSGNERRY